MSRSTQQPHERAVLTGGAGFLGSHLCEHFLSRGFEVICLDNFKTGLDGNVSHLSGNPSFRLNLDITEHCPVEGNIGLERWSLPMRRPTVPSCSSTAVVSPVRKAASSPCWLTGWPKQVAAVRFDLRGHGESE